MHPTAWGVESFPVTLQKAMAVFALSGLLATTSVADATSFCRTVCASHIASLASSELAPAHHANDSRALAEDAAKRGHMHRFAKSKAMSVSASTGVIELQPPPCSQYRQMAVFLGAAGTAVTKDVSESSAAVADVPAAPADATFKTTFSLTESPPGSVLRQSPAAEVLRI